LQAYLLFGLILNNRVNIHVSHMRLVQLSLHLLIVEAEDIVFKPLTIILILPLHCLYKYSSNEINKLYITLTDMSNLLLG
jgi:hypothetical protein